MKKWVKIALAILIVISIAVSAFLVYALTCPISDGFPTNGTLTAEQTGESEITFTIHGDVEDYYGPVRSRECAYSLWVGDICLSSDEYVFREFGDQGWIDMNFTKGHAPGISNANLHEDGGVIYLVYFSDLDHSGYLSDNDTITLTSAEPLNPNVQYRIFLATDINDDEGHANYIGTLNGPQRSGW